MCWVGITIFPMVLSHPSGTLEKKVKRLKKKRKKKEKKKKKMPLGAKWKEKRIGFLEGSERSAFAFFLFIWPQVHKPFLSPFLSQPFLAAATSGNQNYLSHCISAWGNLVPWCCCHMDLGSLTLESVGPLCAFVDCHSLSCLFLFGFSFPFLASSFLLPSLCLCVCVCAPCVVMMAMVMMMRQTRQVKNQNRAEA